MKALKLFLVCLGLVLFSAPIYFAYHFIFCPICGLTRPEFIKKEDLFDGLKYLLER